MFNITTPLATVKANYFKKSDCVISVFKVCMFCAPVGSLASHLYKIYPVEVGFGFTELISGLCVVGFMPVVLFDSCSYSSDDKLIRFWLTQIYL